MTGGDEVKVDGRRERRRRSRQRMVLAAYRLFCDGGLDVPLTAIAAEAGVSVQSLYATFTSKTELLRAALQYAVLGDDLPTPPHERPWFHQMSAEPDARAAVMILLRGTQGIYDRLGPFAGVFRTAAPDVAAMWAHSEQLRWTGMHEMTTVLLRKGRARPGLTAKTATDAVFVLLGPDTYRSFASLGWTTEAWQDWVADAVIHSLFAE